MRARPRLGQAIAGSEAGPWPRRGRCSGDGWRLAIFPQGGPCSIVTATRFHRQVRDGSACCPCARGTSTQHRTGRRAHCQPLCRAAHEPLSVHSVRRARERNHSMSRTGSGRLIQTLTSVASGSNRFDWQGRLRPRGLSNSCVAYKTQEAHPKLSHLNHTYSF